jgi:hypothetical protein
MAITCQPFSNSETDKMNEWCCSPKIMIHSRCSNRTDLTEYVTMKPEKGLLKLRVVMIESRSLQDTPRQFRQFQSISR